MKTKIALESKSSILFHVAIDGKAACGARVGRFSRSVEAVPEYCRCQRPACRKLWTAGDRGPLGSNAAEVLTLTARSGLTVAEALAEAAERGATKVEAERIVSEALGDVAVDAQWEREGLDWAAGDHDEQ